MSAPVMESPQYIEFLSTQSKHLTELFQLWSWFVIPLWLCYFGANVSQKALTKDVYLQEMNKGEPETYDRH